MVASQGGAIWLWILTRPFAWWPTLKLVLGPRVRIFIAAGAAVFVPISSNAAPAEGATQIPWTCTELQTSEHSHTAKWKSGRPRANIKLLLNPANCQCRCHPSMLNVQGSTRTSHTCL